MRVDLGRSHDKAFMDAEFARLVERAKLADRDGWGRVMDIVERLREAPLKHWQEAAAEIKRLRTQCGGNCRYWEGRWRNEYAENQRLRTLLRRLIDIEGPQPGTKEWADDVCRALEPKP
jgi:hypothetical protein